MIRTYKAEGIVLKRRNHGETDRVITLFTKQYGKLVAIAKGIRKITSKRAGSLEPASQVVILLHKSNGWDVISQVQLVNSFADAKKDLARVTQVHQLLEIIDALTAEHQEHEEVYSLLVGTLQQLNEAGSKRGVLVANIKNILRFLGFGLPQSDSELALKAHLENIIERELRSKKMLSV